MKLKLLSVSTCLGLTLTLMPVSSRAAVTFNFDTTGSPVPVPADALTAATNSGNIISAALTNIGITTTTTIDVQLHFNNLGAGVLGAATPVYPAAAPGSNGINWHVVPWSKIKGLGDANGSSADIQVEMNSIFSWYYDFDPGDTTQANPGNPITGSQSDFHSTMIHELVHSIGWLESMDQNGNPGSGQNSWGVYDQWVGDHTSTFLNTTTFALDTTGFMNNVEGGTGTQPPSPSTGLYFHGTHVQAANGGNPVPLYSPTIYQGGSSVSHWDTDYFQGGNNPSNPNDFSLMNHAGSSGAEGVVRSFNNLDIAMLQDIFQVPEPNSALLVLIGGALMFVRRRQ